MSHTDTALDHFSPGKHSPVHTHLLALTQRVSTEGFGSLDTRKYRQARVTSLTHIRAPGLSNARKDAWSPLPESTFIGEPRATSAL